jgi:hypothetical protein|tara:strand:+ start:9612 stop:10370 length:759 start_codon:yes stop_codon:yes gene_type:complete
MEPAKVFNNVIIGQFVLTGVPVKVYVNGRYLIITESEDVEDPTYGFGMDEDSEMQQFDYFAVEHLLVNNNVIELDQYNKGMGATDEPESDEADAEEDKESDKLPKESVMPSIKDILAEISQEEVDAEMDSANAEIDSAKAKFKAAQAAMKNTIKKSKEKIKAAKAQPVEEMVNEDHHYTFGVGDIVKNKNSSCPHHGSIGVVKKVMELPNDMGTVAIYTVMNSGSTYRPGDSLTKTTDQLEPITAIGSSEEE